MKKSPVSRFHEPVLLQEAIEILAVKSGYWYVDATVGGGGHAAEIIRKGGKVLGIDWDKDALEAAKKHLAFTGPDASWQLRRGNFADLKQLVNENGIDSVRGVLFDLGVSTHQLEARERGFSFQTEAGLDMRMDKENQKVTAKDLLAGLYEKELYELFKNYADEQLARLIARDLIRSRRVTPIVTTTQLRAIVGRTYKKAGKKRGKIDPATKVFQALRMAVNDELNNLRQGLDQALETIESQGRIVVVSFHSGEDSIVKKQFKRWSQEDKGRVLTKKPIRPNPDELRLNPRARSAKLRAFEKNEITALN